MLHSCDSFAWNEDIKTDLENDSKSTFRFYDFAEEDLQEEKTAVVEIVELSFGKELLQSEFPASRFAESKIGYHIKGWNYYRNPNNPDSTTVPAFVSVDSENLVTKIRVTPQAADFVAVWAPNTDTKYVVQHNFQNLTLDGYDLDETKTQNCQGTTDTNTSAEALKVEGFTAQTFEQINIAPDGSAVLDIYYNRKEITISVDDGVNEVQEITGYYGQTKSDIELPDRSEESLVFVGWTVTYADGTEATQTEVNITYPGQNAAYTANWKIMPAEANITVTYPAAEVDAVLDFIVSVSFNGINYTISCQNIPEGYVDYMWILDGNITGANHYATNDDVIMNDNLTLGYHSLVLLVTDSEGNKYSREVVIQVRG